MNLKTFHSHALKLKMDGGYSKEFLLPDIPPENDHFNPFSWMMECFSYGECFSYWSVQDSGIHVVFPDDFLSASFQQVEGGEGSSYQGVICYPHMVDSLEKYTEELEFSFPTIGS